MRDASDAVALNDITFVVANDEDNVLRIFQIGKAAAIGTIYLSKLFPEISDAKNQEIDLEGATALGDKIFWIGSHCANKSAEIAPSRNRLIAIEIIKNAEGQYTPKASGTIFTKLIDALEKNEYYQQYRFDLARKVPPKNVGGLSIEGLAATPTGGLLIGFRNPLRGGCMKDGFLVDGKSILAILKNPLDDLNQKKPEFGPPIELDLGGFGIRSIEYNSERNAYFIIAGPYHGNDPEENHVEISRVYTWSGKANDKPVLINDIDLKGMSPEAVFFQRPDKMTILSDDGKADGSGFRAITFKLPHMVPSASDAKNN